MRNNHSSPWQRILLASAMALLLGLPQTTRAETQSEYGFVGGQNPSRSELGRDEEPPPDLSYVYLTSRVRPFRYVVRLPDGRYTVRLHFARAAAGSNVPNSAFATVEIEDETVLEKLPLVRLSHERTSNVTPVVEVFQTTVSDGRLDVDFPPDSNRGHRLWGIEVLGPKGDVLLRVNCGGRTEHMDPDGMTWQPDRPWQAPVDVSVELAPRDDTGRWVNISDEMVRKLVAKDVGPLARWFINGRDGMGVVGVFSDRAGNTYANILGRGLWRYGGPGGTLERADGGRYSAIVNCRSQRNSNFGEYFQMVLNPNGAGFCPISWCSFSRDTAQVCSPDGQSFFPFWQPGDSWDFGTCDWNAPSPRVFLICHHHTRGEVWLSTDGGQNFDVLFDDGSRLQALGVIGPNVLLKALSRRFERGEFVDRQDDPALVGIHHSSDLGKSWQKVSDIEVTRGKGAIIYHQGNNRAYLNTQDGLAVSDDRGLTWRIVPDSPFFVQPVQFGRKDAHLMGANTEGFYESTDGGHTWSHVFGVPEGTHIFFWDPTRDVFYAGVYNGDWYRRRRVQS